MATRHCQHCGAVLSALTFADGRRREQCGQCGQIAWRNPLPVAMALIEQEGRRVLIRRKDPPLAGYWAPPAGYVECGESVPEAVVREAKEETGLDIALDGLFGVYSQADVNVLIIAYRAHVTGGRLEAGDDATEAGLYDPQDWQAQPPPAQAEAIDLWFHGVIDDIMARWRPTCQEESS